MIVISDTGPIITLLKADCLYLLKEVFGEIIIPEAFFSFRGLLSGYFRRLRAFSGGGIFYG